MNIRVFQILVPLLSLAFILWQLRRLYINKVVWKDIWPGVMLWIFIGIIALFPDTIARKLADLLDFESNVNAIFFVLIGILFVSLIRLFDLYIKQQKNITKLTIELSILMAEKDKTVP